MTLWMLYAMLFSTIAAGACFALERGARAVGFPTRFVWLAMLLVAVAVPLALSSMTHRIPTTGSVELVERSAATAGAIIPLSIQSSWMDRIAGQAQGFDRPLVLLWIAFSAFCLGRFVAGVVTLRRKRAHWVAREIVGTECFVTPDIGPAVVAMPDTRIVVPEWVLALDSDSLATVIRHERQHKLARDGWLIVTGSLAAALMPWNPGIWLLGRRLRLAVEMDCDARVLAEEPRVDRYGSLLLAIAQRPRLMAGLGATLTESTSDLERRIDVMTSRPPKHPRLRAMLFAAVGVVAIGIACSMPAPDMVAPHAADPLAKPLAPADVYFDFQVEKPASADPSNLPPRYPEALRAANIGGGVIGRFVVDTNGRPDIRSFEIVKSDHEQFSAAVREALPSMRFRPAEVGGRPVKQLVQMPFSFRVTGGPGPTPIAGVGQAIASRPARVLFETPADDSMPRFLDSNAPPIYPNALRVATVQGMVQAKFIVRPDGRIDMGSFMVIRSDHDAFTAAVRAAAETWRFRPAMKDGKPVSRLIQMPFMFTLAR